MIKDINIKIKIENNIINRYKYSFKSKPIKKISYCSEPGQNNLFELENFKYKEMKSFNYTEKKDEYNSLEINEELYSERNDSSREASNITSKFDINKSLNQDDNLYEKDMNNNYSYINNNKYVFEEQKSNSPNFNFNQSIASFGRTGTNALNNINFSKNSIINQRNMIMY